VVQGPVVPSTASAAMVQGPPGVAASCAQGGARVGGGGRSPGDPGTRISLQHPNTALEATGHSAGFVAGVGQWGVARASAWACVPCMRSGLGVKVPRPGSRGAEGHGKRQGVAVRWGLKAAWNAGAGRGTRTGEEVWYARDEWARHHKVLHPRRGVRDTSGV
ncbi:MAG TPA: hypothetical protein VGC99_09815, partial [Candidatus Tectomicrobia bacterium]